MTIILRDDDGKEIMILSQDENKGIDDARLIFKTRAGIVVGTATRVLSNMLTSLTRPVKE